MKLNEKIYWCRKKSGLSQADLAELTGVSRQSVSKWETGEANPDVLKIPVLAKIFSVSADWLLSEDAPEEPKEPEIPQASHETRSAYPDWIENLPAHMAQAVRRYGWIYGVRQAVGGGLIALIGIVARVMFRTMIFSFPGDSFLSPYGGGFPMSDPFASFNSTAWSVASLFTGFIIGLGCVILICGIVLAVLLKRWGDKNHNL